MGAIRLAAIISFIVIILTAIIAFLGGTTFWRIQCGWDIFINVPYVLILGLISSFFMWTLRPWAWYSHLVYTVLVISNLLLSFRAYIFISSPASSWMPYVCILVIWLLVFILLVKNPPKLWKQPAEVISTTDATSTGKVTFLQQRKRRNQLNASDIICLVLIAVVVLEIVILPINARLREQERTRGCQANLKTLMTAVEMYAQDHNGRYPGQRWADALYEYEISYKQFICPSDASGDQIPISYGLNSLLVQANDSGIQTSLVHMPAQVGMLTDCWPHYFREEGGSLITRDERTDAKGRSVSSLPDPCHNGINIVYCDGHVSFIEGKYIPPDDPNHPVNTAFFRAKELGYIADTP